MMNRLDKLIISFLNQEGYSHGNRHNDVLLAHIDVIFLKKTNNKMARVRCCTDLDKTVLTQNFDKRSWITVSSDEDWNFFWLVIYLFN